MCKQVSVPMVIFKINQYIDKHNRSYQFLKSNQMIFFLEIQTLTERLIGSCQKI